MTAAALLAYALVLGSGGAHLVAGRAWATRAPRAALAVWAGLVVALSVAVILLGAVLAASVVPVPTGVADFVHACVLALRHRSITPGGAALSGVGIILTLGWLARLGYCVGRALLAAARVRRRLTDLLTLLGIPDPRLGVVVVTHATPTIYCLPGRPGTIVVSSAARDTLRAEELRTVLAHEHAHLRGRHHLLLATAHGVTRAFPRVPLCAAAHDQVARLVELVADDAAARRGGRLTLATALVRVAAATGPPTGSASAAVLAAAAHQVTERVRRLLQPSAALNRSACLVLALAAPTALLAPLVLSLAPAVLMIHLAVCPFGVPAGIGMCVST